MSENERFDEKVRWRVVRIIGAMVSLSLVLVFLFLGPVDDGLLPFVATFVAALLLVCLYMLWVVIREALKLPRSSAD